MYVFLVPKAWTPIKYNPKDKHTNSALGAPTAFYNVVGGKTSGLELKNKTC